MHVNSSRSRLRRSRSLAAALTGALVVALPVLSGAPALAQSTVPADYARQVEIRLQELERQVRTLTGQVQELEHRATQAEDRLSRALADVEYRLDLLEGNEPVAAAQGGVAAAPTPSRTNVAPTTPSDPSVTVDPSAAQQPSSLQDMTIGGATINAQPPAGGQPTTSGTLGTLILTPGQEGGGLATPSAAPAIPTDPDGQYRYAFALLQGNDFAGAETAFRDFLNAHGSHWLASNAHFWLGETYFIRSRYNEAAQAFAQGYQAFPDGERAIDSLFKLGLSLSMLGQRDNACLTFSQLADTFPNAPAQVQIRADQERTRLACQ